jgi:XTP/dITP diphosphohydrolase
MDEWVLASRNVGKAEEFQEMLAPRGVKIVPLYLDGGEVVPETGDSYLANATAKAVWVAERLGRVALADDSGLEVDALDGRPGLYSARYAGGDPANLLRVLEELMLVPWERRTARMRATVVLAWPDGRVLSGSGVIEGRMAMAPRGPHGFGYDPGFELPDGRTMAELSRAEKNARSHRRKALDALWQELQMAHGRSS